MTQNKSAKNLFLCVLLAFGVVTVLGAFSSADSQTSGAITFAPLFRLIGKAPQSVTRAVTKVMPVDSMDEGAIGEEIRRHFVKPDPSTAAAKTEVYLNQLIDSLDPYKHKPFRYSVVLMESSQPNAMALPGGIIMVTSGLLKVMKSESELVAVMAHEMGHVELFHCFESVKYEMLSKKILQSELGVIADFAQRFMLQHAYSKTQEDEADEYAFKTLTVSRYNPNGEYKAFERLMIAKTESASSGVHPLRDYFMSHPPLEQRMLKFGSEAKLWWRSHEGERRYVGAVNLQKQVGLEAMDGGAAEWASGAP